ncbi:hypothetical protein AWQ22_07640 [Picosynechococcus sp. PCC 7117]|uniref:cupin domain-containing protein n=2 Tax=Cyanobacteriota TaxID=1117 RepID=UPI0008103CDF|nr:hypothetical protein AWQ22_07640 [Picosynechococcus sp. PCC 7117]
MGRLFLGALQLNVKLLLQFATGKSFFFYPLAISPNAWEKNSMATIRGKVCAGFALAIASVLTQQALVKAHPPEHFSHPSEIAQQSTGVDLPPGPNTMLRAPVSMAENLEVIISDVIIPPGGSLPLHYHPGEEFIYLLEGSVIHIETGKPNQILVAGDTYVIPPYAQHAPQGGPEGGRAIVFRVHVKGEPERILVESEE